jgi:hypothetical protein
MVVSMTKDEALKLALVAFGEIDWSNNSQWQSDRAKVAIATLKEALAQTEQEPVMEYPDYVAGIGWRNVQPPTQRPLIGLTEDEIVLISADCAATHQHTDIHFARAIEAKLKEKNT